MARIREEIEIDAPVERVWRVVHEDLENVPKWSRNVDRVEMLNGDTPGPGSQVRYDVKLPGGRIVGLEFEQTVFNPPRRCAGVFIGGPLRGKWAYSYKEQAGSTVLAFDADYELGGVLRFVGGVFANQYAAGVRENMKGLKSYIEKDTAKPGERARAKAPRPRQRRTTT